MLHLTKLNEKAIQVRLTRRKVNLSRRDHEAEAFVQQGLNDGGATVNRKLFKDKLNPVNRVIAAFDQLYTVHKAATIRYVDVGPRLIPNAHYMAYASMMREKIADLDLMISRIMPRYDDYVALDIAYRSQDPSKPVRAKVSDYPTAEDFQAAMGVELKFSPLPESSHFLFDLSPEDMAAFNKAQTDAIDIARQDVVSRMLIPVQHLVSKLALGIGEPGHIFRDTTFENVLEGLIEAKKLCLDPSAELLDVIAQLETALGRYSNKVHQLRESPIERSSAHEKLEAIARRMAGFMGASA